MNNEEYSESLKKYNINEQQQAMLYFLLLKNLSDVNIPILEKMENLGNFFQDNNITEDEATDMVLLSILLLVTSGTDNILNDLLKQNACLCGQYLFVETLAGLMWESRYEPFACESMECDKTVDKLTGCSDEQKAACIAKSHIQSLFIGFYVTIRSAEISIIDVFGVYRDAVKRIVNSWVAVFTSYIDLLVEMDAIKINIMKSDVHKQHLGDEDNLLRKMIDDKKEKTDDLIGDLVQQKLKVTLH